MQRERQIESTGTAIKDLFEFPNDEFSLAESSQGRADKAKGGQGNVKVRVRREEWNDNQ